MLHRNEKTHSNALFFCCWKTEQLSIRNEFDSMASRQWGEESQNLFRHIIFYNVYGSRGWVSRPTDDNDLRTPLINFSYLLSLFSALHNSKPPRARGFLLTAARILYTIQRESLKSWNMKFMRVFIAGNKNSFILRTATQSRYCGEL